MGRPWVLGEARYVYTTVSSNSGTPTISSATYSMCEIYDEDTIVASGVASIQDTTVYYLWQPSEAGIYRARINYIVGYETFASEQIIEVRETM